MERRTFLMSAVGGLTLIAGCVGSDPETPDDGPETGTDTPTDTATTAPPSITSKSLEPRQDCETPGSATISTDGTTVTAEGCIVGKNGCMVPALQSATYDADADELSILVVTEDESGPDEACTQQIVHRGYAVTVEFDGGLPGTTTVTHDGAEGERQAAHAETGE